MLMVINMSVNGKMHVDMATVCTSTVMVTVTKENGVMTKELVIRCMIAAGSPNLLLWYLSLSVYLVTIARSWYYDL